MITVTNRVLIICLPWFYDSKSFLRRYINVCHVCGTRGPRDLNSDITAVSPQSKMSRQGALPQEMSAGTDFLRLETEIEVK